MKATDKLMPERDNVVDVVAGRAASAERRDSRLVGPFGNGIALPRPLVGPPSFVG